MAWLFLDTTEAGRFRLGLLGIREKRIKTYTKRAHHLLAELARLIPRSFLPHIEGLCVVSGPGSFSSVRSGVLNANLLARELHVPLVGVNLEDAHDLTHLWQALASGSHASSSIVLPTYITEPNITMRRAPFSLAT